MSTRGYLSFKTSKMRFMYCSLGRAALRFNALLSDEVWVVQACSCASSIEPSFRVGASCMS